jgi:hypothetical protein
VERLGRAAVIIRLVEDLHREGSWCGETHVQKATYFLQELTGVPLGYDFILYKHGPFSFDLRDEIAEMRADEIVKLEPRPHPYGPSIAAGPGWEFLVGEFGSLTAKYEDAVRFVAAQLGNRGVADLERVATALYVTLNDGMGQSTDCRVQRIVQLKPHLTLAQARHATEEVDQILAKNESRTREPVRPVPGF